MNENYRTELKACVLEQSLDQAVHTIIVDLKEHITAIWTQVEHVSISFPETDEDVKQIVLHLEGLNQSVNDLLRGALLSRLQGGSQK